MPIETKVKLKAVKFQKDWSGGKIPFALRLQESFFQHNTFQVLKFTLSSKIGFTNFQIFQT